MATGVDYTNSCNPAGLKSLGQSTVLCFMAPWCTNKLSYEKSVGVITVQAVYLFMECRQSVLTHFLQFVRKAHKSEFF